MAELERVREELVEERARRHFEAGGGSDTGSVSESDPVIDALQHSEDSVGAHTHTHAHMHTHTHTHTHYMQYFNLVASVCEGEFMKRPPNKKMPVSPAGQAERDTVTEERRKVFTHTRTHTHTHARTHTRTHARTHAHTLLLPPCQVVNCSAVW